MLSLLAAIFAASQPAPSGHIAVLGRTAWIVATVGHSEWCPPGNVRLDLRTGRYLFTARAPRRVCTDARLERPTRTGTLSAARLEAVRTAYFRALSEGLEKPVCRDGGRLEEIVISNGGTQVLVLATGSETGSAPDDLTCWSAAASALHDALDRIFDSIERPSGRPAR